MQTRTCFNGGELSPELGQRADLDAYMRGCRVLENWELSQMGGVRRRRGMREFADCAEGARLLPFIYSYSGDGNRFLVVVEPGYVRVLGMEGEELAVFDSELNPAEVRYYQLNALMLLCSPWSPPMALEVSGEMTWSFKEFEVRQPAWRHENEKRDNAITVTKTKTACYVDFGTGESEEEKEAMEGDELRASFWTEQKEAKASMNDILKNVKVVNGLVSCKAGDKIAVLGETALSYWICVQEWPEDLYKEGLDDPEDYPDNFSEAHNITGYASAQVVTSVHDVKGGKKIEEDDKFALKSGFWEYYTCVKDFSALNIVEGANSYADYPGHFVRGIAVGNALPCRGPWNFYCSGLWYGSYEVRKNYETSALTGEWETCGISFSRLGEGSNEQLTGDESDEECYLRLFITRSRYRNNDLKAGFPPESCGNRLIVPGYRHDMRLRVKQLDDGQGNTTYEYVNKVKVDWQGLRTVENWSWKAWSLRYGYPSVVTECQQRLCFAGTAEQPQTVWMSRTDDINNFATGDSDDSAIVKTMYSSSQNPICWLYAMRNQLVCGTAEAEWSIGRSDAALTPSSSPISKHSQFGSMNGEVALQVETKTLFVERGSGRVYECGYSFDIDGLRSKDLTVMAPHVLRDHGGAVQATLMKKPDKVAVYALADGQVALCTYNEAHEVAAWHRWTTEGAVTSVCAMPDGTRNDRLFLVVTRDEGVSIEVIDEDSEYVDKGNRDFYSELYTNALENALETQVGKKPKRPVMVNFGEDILKEGLEIAVYGTDYTKITREELYLPEGWNELTPENTWRYENAVGLRFHGNDSCTILALQG